MENISESKKKNKKKDRIPHSTMMPRTRNNKMEEWIEIRFWNRYVRNFQRNENYYITVEKVAKEASRFFKVENDEILKKIVKKAVSA